MKFLYRIVNLIADQFGKGADHVGEVGDALKLKNIKKVAHQVKRMINLATNPLTNDGEGDAKEFAFIG